MRPAPRTPLPRRPLRQPFRVLAPVLAAALCLVVTGCGGGEEGVTQTALAARSVAGGDAETGRRILRENRYGCGGCHAIPGIRSARGTVGPPLHGMAVRGYVAGQLPNYPDNLVAWIHDPPRIDPESAMPKTGIGVEEAAHVAAYLYTLTELP